MPPKRPGLHFAHATDDKLEYCPALHAMHFTPADDTTKSDLSITTEPAPHVSHADASVDPVVPTNLPASHALQLLARIEPSIDT